MPKATHHKTAQEFWAGGRNGSLAALSQAKVWALTALNEKHGLGLSGKHIANELWVVGRPCHHPRITAIGKWQAVFAKDGD